MPRCQLLKSYDGSGGNIEYVVSVSVPVDAEEVIAFPAYAQYEVPKIPPLSRSNPRRCGYSPYFLNPPSLTPIEFPILRFLSSFGPANNHSGPFGKSR